MGSVMAELTFCGELAGLVRRADDFGVLRYPVRRRASIKDVIEALGVPHTEIYDVRVQGVGSDLSRLLQPGDEVTLLPADMADAYPVDVETATRLRPVPLAALRFVVDENVAGLVPLLRALGFDTAYDRSWDDASIAHVAGREDRFVLSRDRDLLKRSRVVWGRLIRSDSPEDQLREVAGHLGIVHAPEPFARCLRCNVPTRPVRKRDVLHLLEPKTEKHFNEFRQCHECGRIYWRGSHHDHLKARLESLGMKLD